MSAEKKVSLVAAVVVTAVFTLLWIAIQSSLLGGVGSVRTLAFGAACLLLLLFVQLLPHSAAGRGLLRLGEVVSDLLTR